MQQPINDDPFELEEQQPSDDQPLKDLGGIYDVKLSTKTINVRTNFRVDIYKLFTFLPITNYSFIVKNRGRRSKNYVDPIPQVLEEGNIITLKYKDQMRGVDKHTEVRWRQHLGKLEKYITDNALNSNIVSDIYKSEASLVKWVLVQLRSFDRRTELMENRKYYDLWNGFVQTHNKFFTLLYRTLQPLTSGGDPLKEDQLDQKSSGDRSLNDQEEKSTNSFGNCLTIVMYVLGKTINIKLCNNGRFQITGAKSVEHVKQFMLWLLQYESIHKEFNHDNPLLLVNGPYIKIHCCPILTNFNFSVGYNVDRIKLSNFIHNNQEYPNFNSHFEPCSEYTGVTVQSPADDVENIPIDIMTFHNNVAQVEHNTIPLQEYIASLPSSEKEKERGKTHPVKFFVFQSGKILLTNTHEHSMRKACSIFQRIMQTSRGMVEEKLIPAVEMDIDL